MPSPEEKPPASAPEGGDEGVLSRLGGLAWQALPAIGGAIGFAGFVAVIGAAIEWIRFNAAHLPATQAVLAMPKQELVIVGALALGAFVVGAVLAVLLVYLIDSDGNATAGTARGLVAVGFVEMVVTLFFIDVRHPVAYVYMGIWLAVIGIAAAYVMAAVMSNFTSRNKLRHAREKMIAAHWKLEAAEAAEAAAATVDQQSHTDETGKAREQAQLALLVVKREWERAVREWVTAADRIIAERQEAEQGVHTNLGGQSANVRERMQAARERIDAYPAAATPPNTVELITGLDDAERELGHAVRAVVDHLVVQVSAFGTRLKDAPLQGTWLVGVALACVALACLLIGGGIVLLAPEDSFSWVAIMLAVVAVLAMMNLFTARATEKFAWYGVSVFFSVLLFGAALMIALTLDKPSVQPVALIRKSDDVGLCGVFVTQTNERVYVGRLAVSGERPGLIFWVPTSDVDLVSVGQFEPIDKTSKFSALAAAMLQQIYSDRAAEAAQTLKNTTVTKVTDGAKAGETTTTVSETPPQEKVSPTSHPAETATADCGSS